jgi:hypothetical protein
MANLRQGGRRWGGGGQCIEQGLHLHIQVGLDREK